MHDGHSSPGADLTDFEKQLAQLVPRAGIDRDRLMFVAGRRSARRLRLANRLLVGTTLTLACTVAALVVERGADEARHSPRTTGPIVSAAPPVKVPNQGRDTFLAAADGPTNYRLLHSFDRGDGKQDAYRVNQGSLPAFDEDDALPETPRTLLKQYLDRAAERL